MRAFAHFIVFKQCHHMHARAFLRILTVGIPKNIYMSACRSGHYKEHAKIFLSIRVRELEL